MEILHLVMVVTYLALICFVLPSLTVRADIFRVHIRLLPYWVKFVSLGWMVSITGYSYLFSNIMEGNPRGIFISKFLAMGFNLGLLLMALSRDKKEDEFSDQIRLRSMYLSAILLFLLSGFFISCVLGSSNQTIETGTVLFVMILNGALLIYLANYYLSKYFMNR